MLPCVMAVGGADVCKTADGLEVRHHCDERDEVLIASVREFDE